MKKFIAALALVTADCGSQRFAAVRETAANRLPCQLLVRGITDTNCLVQLRSAAQLKSFSRDVGYRWACCLGCSRTEYENT